MKGLDLNVKLSDYIEYQHNKDYRAIDFTVACNPSLRVHANYNLKGKKVSTDYLDRETGEKVVEKIFEEKYNDKELHIVFNWYNREGQICATKTKIIDLAETQWQQRFDKQRALIIDDLKGRAIKYNAGHYIDALYSYFSKEKTNFVDTGSLMFANAIRETLKIDVSTLPEEKRALVIQIQALLNSSLDGVNKVYETLIYLTTIT